MRSKSPKEQLRQSAHRGTEMPDRGAAGANIGTFLNKLNADERASEEKRDHSPLVNPDHTCCWRGCGSRFPALYRWRKAV